MATEQNTQDYETKEQYLDSINRIAYACLCYMFQAELDAFTFIGKTPYEQFKANGAIDDLKLCINKAIESIFNANGGICDEGAKQYTDFTNALSESMPDFADYNTLVATFSNQLHVYALRVGNKKMSKRAANLYTILSKHIDIKEFTVSIKQVIESTNNVIIGIVGEYEENLK